MAGSGVSGSQYGALYPPDSDKFPGRNQLGFSSCCLYRSRRAPFHSKQRPRGALARAVRKVDFRVDQGDIDMSSWTCTSTYIAPMAGAGPTEGAT